MQNDLHHPLDLDLRNSEWNCGLIVSSNEKWWECQLVQRRQTAAIAIYRCSQWSCVFSPHFRVFICAQLFCNATHEPRHLLLSPVSLGSRTALCQMSEFNWEKKMRKNLLMLSDQQLIVSLCHIFRVGFRYFIIHFGEEMRQWRHRITIEQLNRNYVSFRFQTFRLSDQIN